MMFELKILGEQYTLLKKYLEKLEKVIDNTDTAKALIVSENSIVYFSMELSGAVFPVLTLKKDFCESYKYKPYDLKTGDKLELDKARQTILYISFDDLKRLFAYKTKPEDTIKIWFEDNKFKFNLKPSKGKVNKRLSVPLRSPTADEEIDISMINRMRSLEYTANFFVQQGFFREVLDDLLRILKDTDDSLSMKIDNKFIRFLIEKKEDSIDGEIEVNHTDKKNSAIYALEVPKEEIQSLYDMSYIKEIISLNLIAEDTSFRMGDHFPLFLTFSSDGGSVFLELLIAPKESEDYEGEDEDDEDDE